MSNKNNLSECPFCKELQHFKVDVSHETKRGKNTVRVKYKVCIVKESYAYEGDPDCCTGALTGIRHNLKFCPLCGKQILLTECDNVLGEVVHTPKYLDVGLLVKLDKNGSPEKILARYEKFSSSGCYGGLNSVRWLHTGKYMTVDEWNRLTQYKSTDEVLSALNITKKLC
ncbi:MAG: hypothetical protein UGF89_06515 [Acutalibacteraceae bacterium]|nr:hypothetical protein [Acutalibacteraceae bacterium]